MELRCFGGKFWEIFLQEEYCCNVNIFFSFDGSSILNNAKSFLFWHHNMDPGPTLLHISIGDCLIFLLFYIIFLANPMLEAFTLVLLK